MDTDSTTVAWPGRQSLTRRTVVDALLVGTKPPDKKSKATKQLGATFEHHPSTGYNAVGLSEWASRCCHTHQSPQPCRRSICCCCCFCWPLLAARHPHTWHQARAALCCHALLLFVCMMPCNDGLAAAVQFCVAALCPLVPTLCCCQWAVCCCCCSCVGKLRVCGCLFERLVLPCMLACVRLLHLPTCTQVPVTM